MRKLTSGGPSGILVAPHWRAPWGYSGDLLAAALWTGKQPATLDDIQAINRAGHGYEPKTIVGTLDINWDAPQYDFQDDDLADLEPWETLPRFGGDGSWAYKGQHLPDHVDGVCAPRKWLHKLDGSLVRSEGGEPYEVVDVGDGHHERHEVDLTIEWDNELRLWQVVED